MLFENLFQAVLKATRQIIFNSALFYQRIHYEQYKCCQMRNHPEQCLILSENSFERKQNYIRKFTPNSIKCY